MEVIKYLEVGHTQRQASRTFNVAQPTISKWYREYKSTGEVKRVLGGKIDPDKLHAYMKANPDARLKDIGSEFGCSETVAFATCNKQGVIRRKKLKLGHIDLEEYRRLHPNATQKQTAEAFGCKEHAVWRAYKRYGMVWERPK